MKEKVKGLIIGTIIGTMLTGATAFAATGVNINVVTKKLSIYLDGSKKTSATGFIYKGKTYIPVKSAGTAIGKQVGLYNDSLFIGKQPTVNVTEAMAVEEIQNIWDRFSPSPDLIVEVDHTEGTRYVVHVYKVVMDDASTSHTETYAWYYVDKYTGDIDPKS